jgi:hypothetical protein
MLHDALVMLEAKPETFCAGLPVLVSQQKREPYRGRASVHGSRWSSAHRSFFILFLSLQLPVIFITDNCGNSL